MEFQSTTALRDKLQQVGEIEEQGDYLGFKILGNFSGRSIGTTNAVDHVLACAEHMRELVALSDPKRIVDATAKNGSDLVEF